MRSACGYWIFIFVLLSFLSCSSNAWTTTPTTTRATRTALPMSSDDNKSSGNKKMIDVANFAIGQSPASTRFITNKMCPFAQKVWIALEVCNVPYEMKEISLYGPNGKPDWFMKLNKDGTVPVLTCYGGAVVVPDSDLVLDLLRDGKILEGSGGGPAGPLCLPKKEYDYNRQSVETWRKNIKNMLPIGRAAVGGNTKQIHKLKQTLREMEDQLQSQQRAEGDYLCGPKVTVADCEAFPFLWRVNDEFGLDEYDGLKKWLETCNNNKAFSKTVQSSWWWWW